MNISSDIKRQMDLTFRSVLKITTPKIRFLIFIKMMETMVFLDQGKDGAAREKIRKYMGTFDTKFDKDLRIVPILIMPFLKIAISEEEDINLFLINIKDKPKNS